MDEILRWIAEEMSASARRGERIQSPWSGYGELCVFSSF